LSAGLRYSKDKKSYTFRRRNPDLTAVQPCVAPPFFFAGNPAGCGVFGLDLLSVKYSSDRVDWRVALSYDATEDVMLYAQVASGYKAGGNNARPFFPTQLNAFDPEKLVSYEAGIKSTWSNQLRLNLSAFWNDYTSIQLPTTVCTWAPTTPFNQQTPCASQNNVGDAHVWGVEIEGEWRPTEATLIDASFSHLDFKYKEIVAGATAVTAGMISPYTPENKFSFGAQYEFSLGDMGTLTPRIDLSYTDDVYGSAVNAATNFIDDYTLVNARLTWRSEDDAWQIAFEATNLTDKYYYVTMFDLSPPAAGYVHGQPSRPFEWAITVKRRF
jgi:iron complex outermembrane receptor protein